MEPLKEVYNHALTVEIASAIRSIDPHINTSFLEQRTQQEDWLELGLKERKTEIRKAIAHILPGSYREQAEIVQKLAPSFSGLQGMIFPEFIEAYGLDDFDFSVRALKYLTRFSTSEFAIRPFIKHAPDKMMALLLTWTTDENEHVRRLSSEGCRLKLPWSFKLDLFIKDPSPVLKILNRLKSDPAKYVQKSVANNLNDISKYYPEIIVKYIKQWTFKNPNTAWILKHASRTLLKEGHTDVLVLFGYATPDTIEVKDFKLDQEIARKGDIFKHHFALLNTHHSTVKLRVEYVVGYPRKNGAYYKKVFFVTETTVDSHQQLDLSGKLDFEEKSTRKIYSGQHTVSIQVNGKILAKKSIQIQ